MPHFESSWILFLLLKGVFLNMKDVHMDVSYISMQSNIKDSSPMIFDQLTYKTLNIK
jgi:hypothetical protein